MNFKRIFKSGLEKFIREKGSSSAALVVMMAVAGTVLFLYMLQGVSSFSIAQLQDSVDISAYFVEDASEEDISALQDKLLALPEVASAQYITQDQALEQFKADHENDPVILESLEIIGKNPLLASLNIKASDPLQYQNIANFLEQGNYPFIQTVDYKDRAPVIDRLLNLISGFRVAVIAFMIGLALLATLVAFNTTRLAIYNAKEEIEVMKLVGASNEFVRGPFLVQGAIVGVVASFFVFISAIPLFWILSPKLELFLSGFSIFGYFLSHFFWIFLLQTAVGVLLGVLSSMIAIRKYLKV
ncbi:MAG: ABC transporter permease [Candidatus Wildermuthbacteria bacterium]|nr:ABC transporter permease [Candidatus Wildermuthbacteria bacterium]